jgi:hypothetical protein
MGRVRNEWEHLNGLSFCANSSNYAWPVTPEPPWKNLHDKIELEELRGTCEDLERKLHETETQRDFYAQAFADHAAAEPASPVVAMKKERRHAVEDVSRVLYSQPTPVVVPEMDKVCENCDKPYGDHYAVDPGGTATCYEGGEELFRYVHPSAKIEVAPVVVSAEETLRDTLTWVLDDIEDWVVAVAEDSSWDSWDSHYKSFAYGGIEKARKALSAHPSPLPVGEMPKPSIPNDALADRCIHESESGVYTMAMELQAWRKWGKEATK